MATKVAKNGHQKWRKTATRITSANAIEWSCGWRAGVSNTPHSVAESFPHSCRCYSPVSFTPDFNGFQNLVFGSRPPVTLVTLTRPRLCRILNAGDVCFQSRHTSTLAAYIESTRPREFFPVQQLTKDSRAGIIFALSISCNMGVW